MRNFLIFLIIIIGFIAVYNLRPDTSGEVNRQDNPAQVVQNPNVVIQHISQNISDLAPEKEQLGGTFFVTNITLDFGSGIVEYEDGHNAYTARFDYSYINENEVVIKNFALLE